MCRHLRSEFRFPRKSALGRGRECAPKRPDECDATESSRRNRVDGADSTEPIRRSRFEGIDSRESSRLGFADPKIGSSYVSTRSTGHGMATTIFRPTVRGGNDRILSDQVNVSYTWDDAAGCGSVLPACSAGPGERAGPPRRRGVRDGRAPWAPIARYGLVPARAPGEAGADAGAPDRPREWLFRCAGRPGAPGRRRCLPAAGRPCRGPTRAGPATRPAGRSPGGGGARPEVRLPPPLRHRLTRTGDPGERRPGPRRGDGGGPARRRAYSKKCAYSKNLRLKPVSLVGPGTSARR
jgi:hypothetical protein